MSLEAAATDKMIHETIACGLPVDLPGPYFREGLIAGR